MVKIKTILPKKISSKKEHKKKKEVRKKNTSKKEIPVGPKRRLEPHLSVTKRSNQIKTSDSSLNEISESNIQERSSHSQLNEASPSLNVSTANVQEQDYKPDLQGLMLGDIKLPETITFSEHAEEDSDPDAFETDGSYRAVRHKVTHLRNIAPNHASTSRTPKLKFQKRLQPKPSVRKAYYWDFSEMRRLAIALQKFGFKEIGKVTEYVETKSENQIKDYIKRNVRECGHKLNKALCPEDSDIEDLEKSGKGSKKYNRFAYVTADYLASWPNVRKWRRLAYEQMLICTRSADYSKTVLPALLQRFYEEEEEPSDPQVINVKAIYKYLQDCLSCEIPAQLPPKESALMSDLLKDLRLLPMLHDFGEETNFLQNYKEATQYRPFEVKDEFRKNYKQGNENVSSKAVKVPEEIFANLSRHKKLVQSFNPLMIPVWMLQKEQEGMEKKS